MLIALIAILSITPRLLLLKQHDITPAFSIERLFYADKPAITSSDYSLLFGSSAASTPHSAADSRIFSTATAFIDIAIIHTHYAD